MNRLLYYLSLLIIYPISILPFPVLYLVSSFFSFLLKNVFAYRKQVILENLKRSFPNKSHEEISYLQKAYYQNLTDIIVETIKALTISKATISKRCKIENLDVLEDYRKAGRSVVAVLGHYNNWEWAALSSALTVKQKMVVVYKPLSNTFYNNLLNNMRSRFGVEMVAMRDVARFYITNRKETFVACYVADQSPSNQNGIFWTPFLNQMTAVQNGPEKIAKKFNHPVIFVRLSRIKRGHYILNMDHLVDQPKETKEGEITTIHVDALAQQIKSKPENWLWSHKRWKKKPPSTN